MNNLLSHTMQYSECRSIIKCTTTRDKSNQTEENNTQIFISHLKVNDGHISLRRQWNRCDAFDEISQDIT